MTLYFKYMVFVQRHVLQWNKKNILIDPLNKIDNVDNIHIMKP